MGGVSNRFSKQTDGGLIDAAIDPLAVNRRLALPSGLCTRSILSSAERSGRGRAVPSLNLLAVTFCYRHAQAPRDSLVLSVC